MKICTNIKEKNARDHDLNIHEVELVVNYNKENGNNKINNFTKIYLME